MKQKKKKVWKLISIVLALNIALSNTYMNLVVSADNDNSSSADSSSSTKAERLKEVLSQYSSTKASFEPQSLRIKDIAYGNSEGYSDDVIRLNLTYMTNWYTKLIKDGTAKQAHDYGMYHSLSSTGVPALNDFYNAAAKHLLATQRWYSSVHDSVGQPLTVGHIIALLKSDVWEFMEGEYSEDKTPIPYTLIVSVSSYLKNSVLLEGNLKTGQLHKDWSLATIAEAKRKLAADASKYRYNSETRALQDYINGTNTLEEKDEDEEETDVDLSEISDKASTLEELNGSGELLEALQILDGSELDAYSIVKNKYMTVDDLNAFKWNLILSQFAIPYRDSINDVLEQTSFADMASKDLQISTNPYLQAIAEASGKSIDSVVKSNSAKADEEFTDFVKNLQTTYDFGKIAETLGADNVLSFSPVYVDDTAQAVISDLFQSNSLYVHDKITYFGNDVYNPDSVVKTLQNFNTVAGEWSNKEGLEKIQSYSQVVDTSLPVWIQTDGVSMYNLLFVADAIRVGGYGTYENFINTVGNAPLYVDRWGNICAKLSINAVEKYAIVYPAYANPLFTSFSTSDDDYVGVGYGLNLKVPKRHADPTDNSEENLFKFFNCFTDSTDGLGWSEHDKGIAVIDKDAIMLDFESAVKRINGSETFLSSQTIEGEEVISDVSIGTSTKYSPVYNSNILDVNGVPVDTNTYSRVQGANQSTLVPYILRVDSTRNFLLNKPFLSNYTSDRQEDFQSDHFYGCLKDRISAYNSLTDLTQYDARNKSTYSFANTLVMDKFNVNAFTNAGIYGVAYGEGSFIQYSTEYDGITDDKAELFNMITSSDAYRSVSDKAEIGTWVGGDTRYLNAIYSPFTVSDSEVQKVSILDALTSGTKPLQDNSYFYGSFNTRGTALSNGSGRFVMFPSLLNHSYRKGLYTDSLSHIENNYLNIFGLKFNMGSYKGFSSAFSKENLLGNSKGIEKYFSTENIWNALFLDSDNYKTFVTFNYSGEILPSNSNAKLIVTNELENTDIEYVSKTNSKYQKYISVAMLDQTIDIADDWGIWKDMNTASSLLDEAKADAIDYNFSNNQRGFFNPTPVTADSYAGKLKEKNVTSNDSVNVLRYYLNDQRISDVLDKYPLDDVTLMSFIWLNYYFPKTSIADCIDETPLTTQQVVGNDFNSQVAEEIENLTNPTTTETTTGTTVEEDKKEEGINSKLIPASAGITPYNMLSDNNVLRLVYTCENDVFAGDYLYSTESFSSSGEFKTYKASARGNIVQVNVPHLLLAINKNTSGEALQYYRDMTKESDYDTTELLDKIALFFDSPVLSILNMFEGILQAIHRFVACGSLGAIYDTSYITNWIVSSKYRYLYFTAIGIALALSLGIQGFKYLMNSKEKCVNFIKTFFKSCTAGIIPVLLIYVLNTTLYIISQTMSSGVAEKLALVEIEQEVKSNEKININFDTQYQQFREQFEGIEDDYAKLSLKFLQYKDKEGKPVYNDIPVSELYDTVSYNTVLSKAMAAAQIAEQKYISNTSSYNNIPYKESGTNVSQYYYTYEEFVPVNYQSYSNSIFYYFYDWYRYQYLRYWATNDDADASSFTKFAKLFSKPEYNGEDSYRKPQVVNGKIEDNQYELWSNYILRLKDAEESLASKAYGGISYMYTDADYVYSPLSIDGKQITDTDELVDIAGLANLFNTTVPYYTAIDGKDLKYYNGVIRYYPSINDDFSNVDLKILHNPDTDEYTISMDEDYVSGLNNDIYDWARANTEAFETIYSDYTSFATNPGKSVILNEGLDKFYLDRKVSGVSDVFFTRQYNKISECVLPITQLISSASWDSYAKSSKLFENIDTRNKSSFTNYTFMPANMWYNYYSMLGIPNINTRDGHILMQVLDGKRPYSDLLTRSSIDDKVVLIAQFRDSSIGYTWMSDVYLKTFQDKYLQLTPGQRLSDRVYASKNTLYKHLYNPETGLPTNVEIMPIENHLMEFNQRVYDDIQQLIEFMPGEIRDSTLIFCMALMTTFEFNQYFSTAEDPAYPQSVDLDTVSMDQIMRVSFADSVNSIVKEKNVIYMLCDTEGGLFVAIPVIIGEVALWIAFIFRVLLIFALFAGALILCFGHILLPQESKQHMWIGILTQCMAIVLSQVLTLGSTLVLFSTLEIEGNWFTNIIKALCIMMVYIFVCFLNFKMLTALISSFKTFGGDVFARSIETARAHIDTVNSTSTNTYASEVNVNMTPEERAENSERARADMLESSSILTSMALSQRMKYQTRVSQGYFNPSAKFTNSYGNSLSSLRGVKQVSIKTRVRNEAHDASRALAKATERGRYRIKNKEDVKATSARKMSLSSMHNLTEPQKKFYLAQTAVRAKYNSDTKSLSKMKERQLAKELYTYMETGKLGVFSNKDDIRQMSTVIKELRDAPIGIQAKIVSKRVQRL